jgi:hypothetical protein
MQYLVYSQCVAAQIRDYQREGEERGDASNSAVEISSMAFSIMCMFLTVVYAGFAALTFAFSHSVMEENNADAREEAYSHNRKSSTGMFTSGYIGERFDVRPQGGFVAPSEHEGQMA